MVVVCYLALFAATTIPLIPRFHSKEMGEAKDRFFRSLFAAAAAIVGLVINCTVLVKSYSFITLIPTHLNLPNWEKLPSILKSFPLFLGAIKPDYSLPKIIIALLMIFLCLAIGYMSIRLIFHWKRLTPEVQVLLSYFLFSFLITVFSPIISTQWWDGRYIILPAIGFLVIIAAYMDLFKSENPIIRKSVCSLMLLAMVSAGLNQCFLFARTKRLPQSEDAYSYILNSGIEFGFGDWNTSDLLTELSNGRIRLCKIAEFKDLCPWYWLMEKDFQKYARGKPVFLIINNSRLVSNAVLHFGDKCTSSDFAYLDAGIIAFRDKHYTVWKYESFEQLESLVGKKF